MAQESKGPQTVAPVWFFLLLPVMLGLHFGLPLHQWNLGMTRWAGLPLAVLGFGLVVVGAGRFRGATTLRPYEESSELVTDGLHAYSRNPMYLSLGIIHVGIGIAGASVWIIASAVPTLVIMGYGVIGREERYLEAKFGEIYLRYKQTVRRWL